LVIDAIILCGGKGSRLSIVWDGPKCLAPVHGRPFISRLVNQLHRSGFKRAVLCVGYKSADVEDFLGDEWGDLMIDYSRESAPLGTGGALAKAAGMVDGPALVLNGDSYLDHPLDRLTWEWELQGKPEAFVVATYVPDGLDKHALEFDDDGRVTRYCRSEKRTERWVSAGVYVLDPDKIAAKFKADAFPLSLEDVVLPSLVKRRKLHAVGVWRPFIDIGTPESYAAAESFFNNISPTACAAARER
jgi:D-glycero-alpha-D-manno-heptose 1-phosphate guanylyltransferase